MIILHTKNVIGHGFVHSFIHKGDHLFSLGIEILNHVFTLG